jgi:hypothetical protein
VSIVGIHLKPGAYGPVVRYGAAVAEKDPYELLGVPRDASDARIRAAYELEVNRATRDGAIRYAAELSAAYDSISSARRRALYDRHGFAPIHERSPGAAPPPRPRDWQAPGLHDPAPDRGSRRGVKVAVLFLFAVGLAAWFIGATQHGRAARNPGITTPPPGDSVVVRIRHEQRVLCQAMPGGAGYLYSEPVDSAPHCDNGAIPVIVGHS